MKKSLLLAVIIAAASSPLLAQEVIVNGGFESSTPPNTFSPGWVHSGDTNALDYVGTDSGFSHSGNKYAALGASPDTGTLSETFATTAGQFYTLSFWVAHDVFSSPDNSFQVFWNGNSVYSLTDVGAFDYINVTLSLQATSASTTLAFTYNDNDDFFRLDDVSVQQVPEPSATCLAALGLGLVALRRIQKLRRG